MDDILNLALEMGASDIHLSFGHHPFFRVRGKLVCIERIDILSENNMNEIKNSIIKTNNSLTSQDGAFSHRGYRFRYNLCNGQNNPSISIRIVPITIPGLDGLNLPSGVKKILDLESGLVLISGKTGSGKSTSLAALIEEINTRESKKIIIIEDPIEYVYSKQKSLIIQREIGTDIDSDEDIRKTLVRQDPDIIVVGEVRDNKSIKLCIELAELGHLVLASIHANSIIDTVSRLVEVFADEDKNYIRYRLSCVLQAILNQNLLSLENKQVPICELLILEEATRSMIKENKNASMINDRIYALNKINGSETRIQNILALLEQGIIKDKDLKTIYSKEDIEKILKLSYNRNII